MDPTNDPNHRRRVEPETQRARDAEVARMRRAGVPFRTIASRLDMSLGAVQKSLRRAQKLAEALAGGEPAEVVAAVLDDELKCYDVTCAADVERLSELERWRLRHLPGEFGDAERARVYTRHAAGLDGEPVAPTVYPVSDGHSWREGVMPPGPATPGPTPTTSGDRPTPDNVHRGSDFADQRSSGRSSASLMQACIASMRSLSSSMLGSRLSAASTCLSNTRTSASVKVLIVCLGRGILSTRAATSRTNTPCFTSPASTAEMRFNIGLIELAPHLRCCPGHLPAARSDTNSSRCALASFCTCTAP